MTDDDAPKAHEWTPEAKVAFVLEAAAVPSAELGAFLRRRGVLEAQLNAWRKQVTEGAVASMRAPTRWHADGSSHAPGALDWCTPAIAVPRRQMPSLGVCAWAKMPELVGAVKGKLATLGAFGTP